MLDLCVEISLGNWVSVRVKVWGNGSSEECIKQALEQRKNDYQ